MNTTTAKGQRKYRTKENVLDNPKEKESKIRIKMTNQSNKIRLKKIKQNANNLLISHQRLGKSLFSLQT